MHERLRLEKGGIYKNVSVSGSYVDARNKKTGGNMDKNLKVNFTVLQQMQPKDFANGPESFRPSDIIDVDDDEVNID